MTPVLFHSSRQWNSMSSPSTNESNAAEIWIVVLRRMRAKHSSKSRYAYGPSVSQRGILDSGRKQNRLAKGSEVEPVGKRFAIAARHLAARPVTHGAVLVNGLPLRAEGPASGFFYNFAVHVIHSRKRGSENQPATGTSWCHTHCQSLRRRAEGQLIRDKRLHAHPTTS